MAEMGGISVLKCCVSLSLEASESQQAVECRSLEVLARKRC